MSFQRQTGENKDAQCEKPETEGGVLILTLRWTLTHHSVLNSSLCKYDQCKCSGMFRTLSTNTCCSATITLPTGGKSDALWTFSD